MNKFSRTLQLSELLNTKSHFLFGPRATGKSFLIREQLSSHAVIVNLLRTEYYLKLSAAPSQLENIIEFELKQLPPDAWIVIDEVQKIPMLLDEVHRLIEEKHYRFLLTGSSARKLKYGQSNLLAGRAWKAELFPLTSREIPEFDLENYLIRGGMPAVVLSNNPAEELDAYVSLYLREEIQAEGLVRNLAPFSRFLTHAAQSNGQILNFSKLGNDAQLPPSTVREYFQILEDTLIGFTVPAWTQSTHRKAQSTAKFFFFDIGVVNTLCGIHSIERNSDLYGTRFEQFMALELRAMLSYFRVKETLSFWRTTQQDEVDFLIGNTIAIEVKSKTRTSMRDTKGLKHLRNEGVFTSFFLVSQDPVNRIEDGIQFVYWETFLDMLWKREIVSDPLSS